MNKKNNWKDFKAVLEQHGIKKLYHFTDRENVDAIIQNGGLYSWADCEAKGIHIPKPGGDDLSRNLDTWRNLQHYVRVSFTRQHPMMYVAMREGRISNPVILEIDLEVIYAENTKFADCNATKTGVNVGGSLGDFKQIHFDTVKERNQFNLNDEEKPYYQAEVLVKNFIPIECITNIKQFSVTVPNQIQKIQIKIPYTAQIKRNSPTAFIFMIDQSVSMRRPTIYGGKEMTMSEAVARIVNNQINELVYRCIKTNEIRHYYDIALIGYGHDAYSAWNGELVGRDFLSPAEIKNHPYRKITIKEEVRTRRGVQEKEVEKVQWLDARHDGKWTHVHKAFDIAKRLLNEWMSKHQKEDCYPPTIINITDGIFNGATDEYILQQANELKAMFTNDGNVLLFNIHIVPDQEAKVVFPISKSELGDNKYAQLLFDMSSLLPERYNQDIANLRGDEGKERHSAMAINADLSTLLQLMDIGTPTNISRNQ